MKEDGREAGPSRWSLMNRSRLPGRNQSREPGSPRRCGRKTTGKPHQPHSPSPEADCPQPPPHAGRHEPSALLHASCGSRSLERVIQEPYPHFMDGNSGTESSRTQSRPELFNGGAGSAPRQPDSGAHILSLSGQRIPTCLHVTWMTEVSGSSDKPKFAAKP